MSVPQTHSEVADLSRLPGRPAIATAVAVVTLAADVICFGALQLFAVWKPLIEASTRESADSVDLVLRLAGAVLRRQ